MRAGTYDRWCLVNRMYASNTVARAQPVLCRAMGDARLGPVFEADPVVALNQGNALFHGLPE